MLYIASCTAASNVLWSEFRHIFPFVILIDFSARLRFHYLAFSFSHCLFLVLLAATDYLWLSLRKRCFVKCEIQSIFHCTLTGHHQRIKSRLEINDYHKKRISQNPCSTCTWGSICESSYFLNFFISHSVCTTVAWVTSRLEKFVDEVGSTVFYRNLFFDWAASRATRKADHPLNFTIFHWRMIIIQPAWLGCSTSVTWHMCCWHFCSCSSHKAIPSLREFVVTQLWTMSCFITYISVGFTQVFIMIARIRYKVKL